MKLNEILDYMIELAEKGLHKSEAFISAQKMFHLRMSDEDITLDEMKKTSELYDQQPFGVAGITEEILDTLDFKMDEALLRA